LHLARATLWICGGVGPRGAVARQRELVYPVMELYPTFLLSAFFPETVDRITRYAVTRQ
jgi:hypothetical protein